MQLSQPPTRQVSLASLFDCLLLEFSHLSYAFKRSGIISIDNFSITLYSSVVMLIKYKLSAPCHTVTVSFSFYSRIFLFS